MPYRRLPNTDSARMKALNLAQQKGTDLPPFKLAFSQGSFRKLQALIKRYEHSLQEQKSAYSLQLDRNKEYQKRLRKARLYISHFIQVVNMAIVRGELPSQTRNYYHLSEDDRKLPSLTTDEEVILVGGALIEGEKERTNQGLSPVTNPTIAVVKVHYDKFIEVYNHQQNLRKRALRAHEELNERRDEADELIQQIWNEVEDTFKDLPEEIRRDKASNYGVVYVFRKNELNGFRLFDTARLEALG